MSFELDPEVAATLAAIAERTGPLPSPPPVGDIESRRSTLNAMLAWANNTAQPIADEVETTDHEVTVADGTTILARAQPVLAQIQPSQPRKLLRVGVRNVREVAAQQDLARQPQLPRHRQGRRRERRQMVEEVGKDHRGIQIDPRVSTASRKNAS